MPIGPGGAAVSAEDPVSAKRPMSAASRVSVRGTVLRIASVLGAIVGYGALAALLYLIGLQIYRWFRDGEWTHFGLSDGMQVALSHCCVRDGDTGRLAALMHWLETPVDWLGLHKVFEVMPASLALFAISILGNSIFIYCSDRIDERQGP
jgi:hypothetical protein